MKIFFSPQIKVLLWAVLAAACLLYACNQDEATRKVDLSERKQIRTQRELDSLTYACLPQYSHRVSFSRHHRLVEYIFEQTGLPIRQIFPDTFEAHVKMVGEGKIDISFSNPLVYTRIADRYQARAFARIVEKNGSPTFRGQIICRADNKAIQNIQDCRNKRWMAVAPTSAAGYLFALDHFLKHGIAKQDFRSITFAPGPGGKQEKVVQAVYLGEADVGSIREGTLALVRDQVELDAIRVLANTRRYPSWVYAARKGLDPDAVEAVKQALLDLDPDIPAHRRMLEMAHFQGIIPATDADFDSIRRLTDQVEVNSGD
ncbi:MAG TPA: phosphate/phosphite/phosphonate ABC transporter substrate-binding protein [Desulfosalsimonadaceae bacterium]|nr:phosphate/phosphite/phosphonate ABC transporter substrate-binding protein [Desulfosalsimonadaceae bacterium]